MKSLKDSNNKELINIISEIADKANNDIKIQKVLNEFEAEWRKGGIFTSKEDKNYDEYELFLIKDTSKIDEYTKSMNKIMEKIVESEVDENTKNTYT